MANGVEANQELRDQSIYIDARSQEERVSDFLQGKNVVRNILLIMAATSMILPMIAPIIAMVASILFYWWSMMMSRIRMPIRYPEWTKHPDPSNLDDNLDKAFPGAGIEYMGQERAGLTNRNKREIWCSDSDARTHRIYMGTTGAGKTQALLSMLFNPLCWGSGFSLTDGKSQTDVTANIFVMSRIFWREDDVIILNYMRGGLDRFKEMLSKKRVGVRKTRVSNTWNPFSTANHETINQIVDSIMEKASGDGAQWQAKAINMKNALVQTIAFLRAKGDMLMSVSAIREMMSLDNMVKLAMRDDIPPTAAAAIRSYLSSGLPGFSWQLAKRGRPQSSDTLLQHGYLTGQFTRTLGLMTDTYNDIFGDEIPEFDTQDLILNNRISFTMIPTLEKGVEEAGNLGKMQVASAKMMMSENLGYEIEGDYDDIVNNRRTNTDRPFYIVMDELGYYFAPGIDLMFSQGRSLQIALVAAGQDFQAMAKNNKNEVESMIANTRIKVSLRLEDPKETFDIFSKAAGEAQVAKLSGYELADMSAFQSAGQYGKNKSLQIETVGRVSLQELKKLGPGDGVMLYSDKVIRFKSFNLFMKFKFDKSKVNIRINTFLPIAIPSADELQSISVPHIETQDNPAEFIARVIHGVAANWKYDSTLSAHNDPVFAELNECSKILQKQKNLNAADRGAYLFTHAMAAFRFMRQDKESLSNLSKSDKDKNNVNRDGVPVKKPQSEVRQDALNNMLSNPSFALVKQPESIKQSGDGVDFSMEEPDWSSGSSSAELNQDLIDFSKPVEASLKSAISTVSGLSGNMDSLHPSEVAMVDIEYSKIRALANGVTRISDNREGLDQKPAAASSVDEVLAEFDMFSMMLKK